MRIGLDARYLSHRLTGGVRNYIYNLASELPRCAPHHDFFYYADEKAPFELSDLPRNVTVRLLPWTGAWSSVRNDRELGRCMTRDGLDVVHCPANGGARCDVPMVVTLHDTLNIFPMSQHLRGFGYSPRKIAMMLYLGRQTRLALARAARLIAVSQHARHDIARRTCYPLDRIVTIYEAAAPHFNLIQDPEALRRCRVKYGLNKRVILADAIKNPQAAVDAVANLPASLACEVDLVFFSREADPRPPVRNALAASSWVRFIARPSDDELVALFNLADVFLLPSWYEGFGLSLVEAMRCGTPVVGSTRGSIPEIIGDGGLVFDLEDLATGTNQLSAILRDDLFRGQLSDRALRRAQGFTWSKAALETVSTYEGLKSGSATTAGVARGIQ